MKQPIWIIFTLILVFFTFFEIGNSKKKSGKSCKDTLSKKNFIKIQGKNGKTEKVMSCKKLAQCFPAQCPSNSGNGGKCCKSCKALGDLTCMDQLSKCNPLEFDVNGERIKMESCEKLITNYPALCSTFPGVRGKGGFCCRSCQNVKRELKKCSPKNLKANCFCYPKGECDGRNIIACPKAGSKACKKAGKDYQCCCQKEFWHPYCMYDPPKKGGKPDNTDSGINIDPFTEDDLPIDVDEFFKNNQ